MNLKTELFSLTPAWPAERDPERSRAISWFIFPAACYTINEFTYLYLNSLAARELISIFVNFPISVYNKFPFLYILEPLSFRARKVFETLSKIFQLRALDFFIKFKNS